jgi:hypothetical protein
MHVRGRTIIFFSKQFNSTTLPAKDLDLTRYNSISSHLAHSNSVSSQPPGRGAIPVARGAAGAVALLQSTLILRILIVPTTPTSRTKSGVIVFVALGFIQSIVASGPTTAIPGTKHEQIAPGPGIACSAALFWRADFRLIRPAVDVENEDSGYGVEIVLVLATLARLVCCPVTRARRRRRWRWRRGSWRWWCRWPFSHLSQLC